MIASASKLSSSNTGPNSLPPPPAVDAALAPGSALTSCVLLALAKLVVVALVLDVVVLVLLLFVLVHCCCDCELMAAGDVIVCCDVDTDGGPTMTPTLPGGTLPGGTLPGVPGQLACCCTPTLCGVSGLAMAPTDAGHCGVPGVPA